MTELMQLWDELSCSGQDRQDRVMVLAATNRPWDLDPAVQVQPSPAVRIVAPAFRTTILEFGRQYLVRSPV